MVSLFSTKSAPDLPPPAVHIASAPVVDATRTTAPETGVTEGYPMVSISPAELAKLHQIRAEEIAIVRQVVGVYAGVQHAHNSLLRTISDSGRKIADLCVGLLAYYKSSTFTSAPPFGSGLSALLGLRSLTDLTEFLPSLKDMAQSTGELLLDPSFLTMGKLAYKTGELAQSFTRVAYLGAMLGAVTFNPVFHTVNLAATLACSTLGALSEAKIYVINLAEKRQAIRRGEEGSSHGQVIALLKMAANVALAAMAVLGLTAINCSMIPLTVGGGAAMATAASFSLLAKLYQQWSAPLEGAV